MTGKNQANIEREGADELESQESDIGFAGERRDSNHAYTRWAVHPLLRHVLRHAGRSYQYLDLVTGENDRIAPNEWRPLTMSFCRFQVAHLVQ